jgi:hypothetical protein
MSGIVNSSKWLENPDLRFQRENCYDLNTWIEARKADVVRWDLWDFHAFYSHPDCTPHFAGGPQHVDEVYYTVEVSITIINNLLEHKFETIRELKSFLRHVYLICERKIPKSNTLLIYPLPHRLEKIFL